MLETLPQDEDRLKQAINIAPDHAALNKLIARGPEELALFAAMDAQPVRLLTRITMPTCKLVWSIHSHSSMGHLAGLSTPFSQTALMKACRLCIHVHFCRPCASTPIPDNRVPCLRQELWLPPPAPAAAVPHFLCYEADDVREAITATSKLRPDQVRPSFTGFHLKFWTGSCSPAVPATHFLCPNLDDGYPLPLLTG